MTDPISPFDDTGNVFVDVFRNFCAFVTFDRWWPEIEAEAG